MPEGNSVQEILPSSSASLKVSPPWTETVVATVREELPSLPCSSLLERQPPSPPRTSEDSAISCANLGLSLSTQVPPTNPPSSLQAATNMSVPVMMESSDEGSQGMGSGRRA